MSPRFLRTPDERFRDLPDFNYAPHYSEVDGLRIAYIDEGPRDAHPVLLMHGEPSWSFLYRKMIPALVRAGHRVVAPDLVGFGRSDKLLDPSEYSYRRHVGWMVDWLDLVNLNHVTLFCQDWGSLIGLRMVVERPNRFDRVAIGNGGLPTGKGVVPPAFKIWQTFARYTPWFPVGRIVSSGVVNKLSPAERAAYDAPFPTEEHKLAARLFPRFVPTTTADPEHGANTAAWEFFKAWDKPFLTLFSSRDPITRGGEKRFQEVIPGAKGQPHKTIRGAGHFLQEDKGPEVAEALVDWMGAKT
jgi:haloalkane dehalogenase